MKIGGRQILGRALVDSGNLFGTAISSDLAKRLKLKLNHSHKRVGTADKTDCVKVISRVKTPVKIYIENVKKSVLIRPFVLDNLSHPINLGQAFLRYNNCDLYFREKNIILNIGQGCTQLYTKGRSLTSPSTDDRICRVLVGWEGMGCNPPPSNDILCVSSPPVKDSALHTHTHTPISSQTRYTDEVAYLEIENTRHQLYNNKLEYFAPHTARLVSMSGGQVNYNVSEDDTIEFIPRTDGRLWERQNSGCFDVQPF